LVIIDHDDGWTSLITNLGRLDVTVAAKVLQGSPLGLAAPVGRPLRLNCARMDSGQSAGHDRALIALSAWCSAHLALIVAAL
jgi:hypothetical protein